MCHLAERAKPDPDEKIAGIAFGLGGTLMFIEAGQTLKRDL